MSSVSAVQRLSSASVESPTFTSCSVSSQSEREQLMSHQSPGAAVWCWTAAETGGAQTPPTGPSWYLQSRPTCSGVTERPIRERDRVYKVCFCSESQNRTYCDENKNHMDIILHPQRSDHDVHIKAKTLWRRPTLMFWSSLIVLKGRTCTAIR